MKLRGLTLTLILFLFCFKTQAQWGGGEKYPDLKPHEESLKKLKSMRFGMFVHWGPSILRGTSSWGRGNHPYDFAPKVPINEYDSLYLQFNPVLFDASEWVEAAKLAGMKYFVFTTKHHDGFVNFDSDYTEYDIMSTPYWKDVLVDLRDACEKQGILFGTYYSLNDWHHPEYPGRYGGDPRPVSESDMGVYMDYLHNQLDELIEKYRTHIMWFEGYWEEPWTHDRGMDLYKHLRDKKNDLLINNRVDRMRADKEGKINPQKYAGDYKTPEQEIGEYDIDNMWESCITISDTWNWNPQAGLKDLKTLIDILVQTVGGGGNLLLNVGPMMDGRIDMFHRKRLIEIGDWMNKYGETIYGTEGGPFVPNKWTASTRKDNRIFIHTLNWKGDTLIIPGLKDQIKSVSRLDGKPFAFEYEGKDLLLTAAEGDRDVLNTIFVLKMNKPAIKYKIDDAIDFKNYVTIEMEQEPASKYSGDGPETLIDGAFGDSNNPYKGWLGFEGKDVTATLTFSEPKRLNSLSIGALRNQNDWMFAPVKISVKYSQDGESFTLWTEEIYEIEKDNERRREVLKLDGNSVVVKKIEIQIESINTCPTWHKGADKKCWMFVDEISIE